jgi:hypothetical protein
VPVTEAPATEVPETKVPETNKAAATTPAEQTPAADPVVEATVEAQAAAPAAAPDGDGVAAARPKRRWPWIVGAALAVLLIVAGILTAFAVRNAIDSADATTQVLRFDVAYRDTDCSLFESVTTSELRDALLGEPYDCSAWQSVAETLTVDGTYTYDMTVTGTQVNGDSATVSTSETFIGLDGSQQTVDFDYTLTRTDTGWVITKYANA